jgi:hypothetical protein
MRVLRLSLLTVASIAMLANCGCGGSSKSNAGKVAEQKHEHAHPENGPHGGQLIELGNEEFHAELTHDEATDEITVYLLDAEAKQSVPVAETELVLNLYAAGKPQQFKLLAQPQAIDAPGQSSRFSATDEALHEAMEAEGSKGQLNVTIGGKAYSGEIARHEHDGHKL